MFFFSSFPVTGLLEQKGIFKEGADKPSSDAASGGSGDKSSEKSSEKSGEKSEKKNPFAKLKEKLHKH
jgi:prophage tail gpP-like protein